MPVIPAWLVRSNLNDPRKIPYLLVWKDERDGEIKEAVRLAHFTACGREGNDYAELKRTDGTITFLRIVWRALPRNGGRALFCSVPTARPRAVTSTVGSGTAFRDGRTESGASVGDAGLVLGCATLPKVVICVQQVSGGLGDSASCFALTETCHGQGRGFLTCSPHRKKRRNLASASCHPSVGMGRGESL